MTLDPLTFNPDPLAPSSLHWSFDCFLCLYPHDEERLFIPPPYHKMSTMHDVSAMCNECPFIA